MTYFRNIPKLACFRPRHISERRLHNRAKAHWEAVRCGHEFPCLEDFDLRQATQLSDYGFLLHLRRNEAPLVVHAGDVLQEEAMLDSVPVSLAVISKASLLGQFGSRWTEVVQAREPMTSEYEFITEQGYKISCRGILLPLATDRTAIDHIYGVVNWKSRKLGGTEPRDSKAHSARSQV